MKSEEGGDWEVGGDDFSVAAAAGRLVGWSVVWSSGREVWQLRSQEVGVAREKHQGKRPELGGHPPLYRLQGPCCPEDRLHSHQ